MGIVDLNYSILPYYGPVADKLWILLDKYIHDYMDEEEMGYEDIIDLLNRYRKNIWEIFNFTDDDDGVYIKICFFRMLFKYLYNYININKNVEVCTWILKLVDHVLNGRFSKTVFINEILESKVVDVKDKTMKLDRDSMEWIANYLHKVLTNVG